MTNPPPSDALEPLFDEFPPVSREAWEAQIAATLKRPGDREKLNWHTPDGFILQPYYLREDLAGLDYLLGDPGQYPYARGYEAQATRTRPAVTLTHDDLVSANRLARLAVERDAGLHLHAGLSAGRLESHPLTSKQAVAALIEGLPLENVPVHLTGSSTSLPLLALWASAAGELGFSPEALRGTVGFNPLSPFERFGWHHHPQGPAWTARLVREGAQRVPGIRLLALDGSLFHDAGATSAQTLAFTLGAANELLAHLTEQGLDPDQLLGTLHVTLPLGVSFFMSLARLRAFRLLFARLVEAYTGNNAARPYLIARTSRPHRTLYDPYVNMLRSTTEAAAALMGGVNVLVLEPHDALFGRSDQDGHRLALNLPLILQHESHLNDVLDPAGGAYYVETLTDRLAETAWDLFRRLEKEGGLLAGMRSGAVQRAVAESRNRWDHAVATGRAAIVGVNQYPDPTERHLDQIEQRPEGIPVSPRGESFFDVPAPLGAMIEAAGNGATLDALLPATEADALPELEALRPYRAAAAFEALRLRVERYTSKTGHPPTVFVLPFGDTALRNARATFTRNFFGCAGFQILENTGWDHPLEGADAAANTHPALVVLCSSDDAYIQHAPALIQRLRAQGCQALVVVAGYPEADVEALRSAGVDAFIHRQSPLLETLRAFLDMLNIQ